MASPTGTMVTKLETDARGKVSQLTVIKLPMCIKLKMNDHSKKCHP